MMNHTFEVINDNSPNATICQRWSLAHSMAFRTNGTISGKTLSTKRDWLLSPKSTPMSTHSGIAGLTLVISWHVERQQRIARRTIGPYIATWVTRNTPGYLIDVIKV